MNPLHMEILAHDRMATLRREAAATHQLAAGRAEQPSRRGQIAAVSGRTIERVRIVLRLAGA